MGQDSEEPVYGDFFYVLDIAVGFRPMPDRCEKCGKLHQPIERWCTPSKESKEDDKERQ